MLRGYSDIPEVRSAPEQALTDSDARVRSAAERALQLAQRDNNAVLVRTLESNIVSFRSSAPLRDYQQRR